MGGGGEAEGMAIFLTCTKASLWWISLEKLPLNRCLIKSGLNKRLKSKSKF